MPTHRRPLIALAAAAAGAMAITASFAAGAESATPQQRTAGTTGAKEYRQLAKKADYVKLDLLAINDFHGNLEPPTGSSGRINNTSAGGAAYLASVLNKERKKSRAAGAQPLTVAAGDLIGASPLLSGAFHDEPTIKAMNQMHLDVTSVGNHEFDEGYKELQRLAHGGCIDDGDGLNNQNSCPDGSFAGADFDYLAANVKYAGTDETILPAYTVKNVKGAKIGFIGMTLEDTPSIVTASGVAGLEFDDEVATANALVPVL
ncbi:MAG TPA: bifunctional metallophosphatase/5'-nucleotidase, partial [Nocardioides sp.]|nr:bifunctional metallophosphatase/5'-nucleotidase [Nocardioides sp.]